MIRMYKRSMLIARPFLARRLRTLMIVLACALPVWAVLSAPMSHAAESRRAPKAVVLSEDDQAALARASAYLNGMATLEARFTQVAPDGSLSNGAFTLSRPGRMRFEYREPTPLLVLSDGTWVIVHDKAADSTDRYPLGATPLDIILSAKVDLAKDLMVTGVERRGAVMRVTGRDRDEPGKGEVTLVFDESPIALRQWIVTDAQGFVTTVSLDDLRLNVPLDLRQFVFVETKPKRRER